MRHNAALTYQPSSPTSPSPITNSQYLLHSLRGAAMRLLHNYQGSRELPVYGGQGSASTQEGRKHKHQQICQSFRFQRFLPFKESIEIFSLCALCIAYHRAEFCCRKNRFFKLKADEEMYRELTQLQIKGYFLPTRGEGTWLLRALQAGRLTCDPSSDDYECCGLRQINGLSELHFPCM